MTSLKSTITLPLILLFSCSEKQSTQTNRTPSQQVEVVEIETDDGTVVAHSSEDPISYSQKTTTISAAESKRFETWANEAPAFLATYIEPQSENDLKQYDKAFKAWQKSNSKKHSDQDVINILGAYLGQTLIKDLDMEWIIVNDEYGQDYALQHKSSELISFPFSSVMKRIEDEEYDFLFGIYHLLKHQAESRELESKAK